MRVVACSDAHLDLVTMGVSRFDEVADALRRAGQHAIMRGADLFLFCGDLCDPDSGPVVLRCARQALLTAVELQANGIKSVWVCGNHDVAGDGLTTSLDPLEALDAFQVGVMRDSPAWFEINEEWSLLALPYPSNPSGWKRSLAEVSAERPEGRIIVAGHLSIEGVQPGEESREMARGRDVFWPKAEADASRPDAKLAGHYHRRQVTSCGIQIIGSLARGTFGEEDHEPGFLELEIP